MKNFISNCREAYRFWRRRKEMPFTMEEMEEKKLFWSRVYALSGISTLALMTYFFHKKERERDDISSSDTILGLQSEKAKHVKLIRIVNFSKLYEVDGSTAEFDKFREEIAKKELQTNPRFSKNVPEEPSLIDE